MGGAYALPDQLAGGLQLCSWGDLGWCFQILQWGPTATDLGPGFTQGLPLSYISDQSTKEVALMSPLDNLH